ncbi:hypothetical protein NGC38_24570, partial [Kluyvera cryocrescens]|uniref:hypothetical protein n=1 Tax=Kluyvera cryocrescens TaxID=580 RepID=UPI002DBD6C6F
MSEESSSFAAFAVCKKCSAAGVNTTTIRGFIIVQTQKSPSVRMGFFTYLMPGSSLLSHGETPHYHRRYGVSLLS